MSVTNPSAWRDNLVLLANCRKCGEPFVRTLIQASSNVADCNECRNAYKRGLRRRKRAGEKVRRECACGARISKRNKDGLCIMCRWQVHRDKRVAEREAAVREMRNPTKEETWLRVGKQKLAQARRMLRDASRSRKTE